MDHLNFTFTFTLILFARNEHQWRCGIENHKKLLAPCYTKSVLFKNESDAVLIVTTKRYAVLLHRYTQLPPSFSAASIDPSLKVAW
jgi:hypothetical protein